MGLEIEHKYLVKDLSYREMSEKKFHIIQGYLSKDPERTVRVRIKDDKAFITIKGITTNGESREEFEYEVPVEDARRMLRLALPGLIEKIRYIVPWDGMIWEVDDFISPNPDLTVAEVELPSSGHHYSLPPFAGENVTGNPAYYNSNL
ncbi:MAG: CYTH domain-containing protein [Muribaculaceae bacterium]|nr:CYTH domain-containing protein [Muribaculaceae bacterium]